MMRWDHALSLIALVLVPALALFYVWAARRRRRALDAFVAASLMPAVVPDLDLRRRRIRAMLRVGALFLLVVALSGPMWGFRWEEVHREGIDLVIALDTSRSMLANDVKPNRLARAKLAVRDLLTQLGGDRVALVAFAGTAFAQCPLTLDYGAFAESLEAIEVGIIPKGGTALAEAIDTGLKAFEGRQGKHQALIVITDGEDHEGNVEKAIKDASDRGVKVFTVGIGTAEGELIPGESGGFLKDRSGQVVKSRLDEETLKKIAVDTGGVYMHAGGTTFGLAELYRDYIATMEKRELASTLERRYEHRFQIPLALALLLLVGERLVGDRRVAWRRWRRRAADVTTSNAGAFAEAPPATTHRASASSTALPLVALLVALTSIGWLDQHATGREAHRLYTEGKFDEAVSKYNQALIDQPDSPVLHFNLGDAAYKQGKLEDALNAFSQVPTEGSDESTAKVAYNVGNTKYRMGAAAEGSDAKNAMKLYAEALVAYRRAIGAAPQDPDPKYNYELTVKKLEELKKKLEEQQKQQEQQQQQQQQDQKDKQDQQQQADQDKKEDQQGSGDQQKKDEQQQADQQQKDQQQQEQKQEEQQQAKDEQKKDAQQGQAPEQRAANNEQPPQPQQQANAAEQGEKREGEMSPQEATALLDAQRDDEVQPDQVMKRLQGGVVAEPAQDW